MSIKPEHREALKAFATGDVDRARALNSALPEEDRVGHHLLLGALFAVLLDHHLEQDTSRATIAAFVERLRRDHESEGLAFDAVSVENVIRATAGEEDLLASLANEDIMSAHAVVVGRLAHHDPAVATDIDRFLDHAETLVDEWEQAGRE